MSEFQSTTSCRSIIPDITIVKNEKTGEGEEEGINYPLIGEVVNVKLGRFRGNSRRFLASVCDNDTDERAAVIAMKLHPAKRTRHRVCRVCTAFAETFGHTWENRPDFSGKSRSEDRDISKSLIDQLTKLRRSRGTSRTRLILLRIRVLYTERYQKTAVIRALPKRKTFN